MSALTETFQISTRDDVVYLCKQIAKSIRDELIRNPDRKAPIVISLTGEDNSGKSLFWDAIRENLFKHGGIFIKSKSESNQKDPKSPLRSYETWAGTIDKTERQYSLFACNVGQLFHDYMGEFHLSRIADPLPDIVIVSKSADVFVSSKLHAIEIDTGSTKKWKKSIRIHVPEQSPLRPEFNL